MQILERWAISFCAAVLLMSTGASADPPAPPASAPADAAGPAASPTAAGTATPSAGEKPPASTADPSAEQAKLLKSQGYKSEVVRGQTVYCRSESATGTRFTTKTCSSAAEIARRAAESRETTDQAQRAGGR